MASIFAKKESFYLSSYVLKVALPKIKDKEEFGYNFFKKDEVILTLALGEILFLQSLDCKKKVIESKRKKGNIEFKNLLGRSNNDSPTIQTSLKELIKKSGFNYYKKENKEKFLAMIDKFKSRKIIIDYSIDGDLININLNKLFLVPDLKKYGLYVLNLPTNVNSFFKYKDKFMMKIFISTLRRIDSRKLRGAKKIKINYYKFLWEIGALDEVKKYKNQFSTKLKKCFDLLVNSGVIDSYIMPKIKSYEDTQMVSLEIIIPDRVILKTKKKNTAE